jgi:hypothetical protein
MAGAGGLLGNIWNIFQTKKTRAREDNAVQRRAADMEAAGINPIMAAGAPAQAGPAMQVNGGAAGEGVLQAIQLKKQLDKWNSDIGLQGSQAELNNAAAGAKEAEKTYIEQQTRTSEQTALREESQRILNDARTNVEKLDAILKGADISYRGEQITTEQARQEILLEEERIKNSEADLKELEVTIRQSQGTDPDKRWGVWQPVADIVATVINSSRTKSMIRRIDRMPNNSENPNNWIGSVMEKCPTGMSNEQKRLLSDGLMEAWRNGDLSQLKRNMGIY